MTQKSLAQLLDSHQSSILGHRGARGEMFENSLAGFIHTQNLIKHSRGRLTGIEFDVQLTKEGQLLVFHDESMLRLYKHQSRIDQSTINELKHKSLRLLSSGQHPLMVLEDMPPVLTGYSHVELEIKTHIRTDYKLLIHSLKNTLSQSSFTNIPITLTTFDITLHRYMQADVFLKGLKRGLLVEPIINKNAIDIAANQSEPLPLNNQFDINSLVSTGYPLYRTPEIANRLGCVSVGLYYALFNLEIMKLCNRYNLSTSAWTVNSTEEAKRLILLGVNYIITDYPTEFIKP